MANRQESQEGGGRPDIGSKQQTQGRGVQEPLRDIIGRVLYEEPGSECDWYGLSEKRREPWREDADRVLTKLTTIGVGGWVAFSDQVPPTRRRCLVTNNIKARDANGQMSHIWITYPIWSTELRDDGHWVGFDDADRKLLDLSHWLPLPDGQEQSHD